ETVARGGSALVADAARLTAAPGDLRGVSTGLPADGVAMGAAGRGGARPVAAEARAQGYAVTMGEVIPAVTGISAAVPGRGGEATTSIGISVFEQTALHDLGATVAAAATRLGELLD
ncbi:hypothetical protein ACFWIR_39550, partial [Streptomyces olivaceus]